MVFCVNFLYIRQPVPSVNSPPIGSEGEAGSTGLASARRGARAKTGAPALIEKGAGSLGRGRAAASRDSGPGLRLRAA